MARAGWAVTAAGHLLEALRTLWDVRDPGAELARESGVQAYSRVLSSIGTIPADCLGGMLDATLVQGVSLADALDAAGA